MERLVRKIATGALVVVMLIAAVPMVAKADHVNGRDPQKRCNNTYRTYDHTGYQTSMTQGTHQLSDGSSCFITSLVYKHSVTCSSCGAKIANPIYPCTTEHSKCGNRTVNHTGY